jgi:hypothetical protein
MTIARYRKLEGHPAWLYTVELLVQSNGKLISIGGFNCATEEEFSQAVEWCDYIIKGE